MPPQAAAPPLSPLPPAQAPSAWQVWIVISFWMMTSKNLSSRAAGPMAADRVAQACIEQYGRLPKKGKPEPGRQWTVLAGICLLRSGAEESAAAASAEGVAAAAGASAEATCVALATGSKCLGHSQCPADGSTVLDSHAEVAARRSLQRLVGWLVGWRLVLSCKQQSHLAAVLLITAICWIRCAAGCVTRPAFLSAS